MKQVRELLKNQYILYILFALAIVYVVSYLNNKEYEALIVFLGTALITSKFNKNMSVVFISSIVVTNLLLSSKMIREGMENAKKEKKDKKDKEDKKEENIKEGMGHAKTEDDNDEAKEKFIGNKKELHPTVITTKKIDVKVEETENETDGVEDGEDTTTGKRIDYASTLEQAYDNLHNMLGDDGIKGLSDETKKLITQQKDLINSLNTMAPVLSDAKKTLDNINLPDMSSLTDLFSNLTGKK